MRHGAPCEILVAWIIVPAPQPAPHASLRPHDLGRRAPGKPAQSSIGTASAFLEQAAAPVGRLDLVADHVGERRPDQVAGMAGRLPVAKVERKMCAVSSPLPMRLSTARPPELLRATRAVSNQYPS